MSTKKLAAFNDGIDLWLSSASPNGAIHPIAVGSLCIRNAAGSVTLWQCTALPSTWVQVSTLSSGVPLSAITAALANNTIDSLTFAQLWNWSTATTQTALKLGAAALTSGKLLQLANTSAAHAGTVLEVDTNTTAAITAGAVRVSGTADHQSGNLVQIDSATTAGRVVRLVGDALTSGALLVLGSTSVGLTGQLLAVSTASTAALSSGAVSISSTGAHTGSLVNVVDVTATGRVVDLTASALTTGTILGITSSGAAYTGTTGLLNVTNSNNATTGTLVRFKANNAAAESGYTLLCNGNSGFGEETPLATLHNAGSTLWFPGNVGNKAGGGAIGTAAATVDVASSFACNQTTAAQTLTLPAPTDTTPGRIVSVMNVGTTSFTMLGLTVTVAATPQTAGLLAQWNGTAWVVLA